MERGFYCPPRANTSAWTLLAPDFFNVFAISSSVAPLATTSSMMQIFLGIGVFLFHTNAFFMLFRPERGTFGPYLLMTNQRFLSLVEMTSGFFVRCIVSLFSTPLRCSSTKAPEFHS